jgi:hypothetical protein
MLGADKTRAPPWCLTGRPQRPTNKCLSLSRKAHVSGMSSSGVSPSLPTVPKVPMHTQPWDLQPDMYHKYVCTF